MTLRHRLAKYDCHLSLFYFVIKSRVRQQIKQKFAETAKQDYFNTLYRVSFIILYNVRQMHNYFTNYHTPTCFDTIVSSSDSL
jgi:hypothetical protein